MAATEALNTGVLYTDRRQFYLDGGKIHRLWGGITPFNTLIEKLSVTPTPDPDFRMFEYAGNQHNPVFTCAAGFTMTDAGTETASAFTVAGSGTSGVVGLIVNIWTSDGTYVGQGRISTAASSTSIKIKPTYTAPAFAGGLTATGTNTVLDVVGFADEEGAEAPEAWSQELVVVYNSTSPVRVSVELTEALQQMTLRGEQERQRLRFEKGKEFTQLRENKLIWSRRKSTSPTAPSMYDAPSHNLGAGGRQVRQGDGFIPLLENNAPGNIHTLVSANASYTDFINITKSIFKYTNSAGTKMMGCGDSCLAYFNQLANEPGNSSKMQLTNNIGMSKSLGFAVYTLQTTFGTIEMFRVPTLTISANGRYSGWGLLIDPEEAGKAQFMPQMYYTNIKTDNRPTLIKDEYFVDEGLKLTNILKHSAIKVV